MMVLIDFVDGTDKIVEAIKEEDGYYHYNVEGQLFVVHKENCDMFLPREFVKSIECVDDGN